MFGFKSITRSANVPLEYAPVFRGSVEVQVHGIARKVNMDYVRHANDDHATTLHTLPLNVDLFFGDRDIEILSFAKNSRANIVFVLAGVCVQGSLVLHCILELVILKKRRNNFGADVNCAANQEQRQEHFYGAHLPAPQEQAHWNYLCACSRTS